MYLSTTVNGEKPRLLLTGDLYFPTVQKRAYCLFGKRPLHPNYRSNSTVSPDFKPAAFASSVSICISRAYVSFTRINT